VLQPVMIAFGMGTSAPACGRTGFYIHCGCGEEFGTRGGYNTHRRKGLNDCFTSPIFNVSAKGADNAYAKGQITFDRQLSAFYGDLGHKASIVDKYKVLGMDTASYFDGKHMAWYMLKYCPDLVKPGPNGVKPSVHTMATVFESHFQMYIDFRFEYLDRLPVTLVKAPMVEPDGSLPIKDSVKGDFPSLVGRWTTGGVASSSRRAECDLGDPVGVRNFLHERWARITDRELGEIEELNVSANVSSIPFFPLEQVDPVVCPGVPNSDTGLVYTWANKERDWRSYPEIRGYDRWTSEFTYGDVEPWFISALTDHVGRGVLKVLFPSPRSPYDNEEGGKMGRFDGLCDPVNIGNVMGFEVGCYALTAKVNFTSDPFFQGPFHTEVVTMSVANSGSGVFITFDGPPARRCCFIVDRFVRWRNIPAEDGPRPESPWNGKHGVHQEL